MNEIPSKQNEQKQLERLAAQRELYGSAKYRQLLQIILNVLATVVLATLSIWYPSLAPIAAFVAVFISTIDAVFLDPAILDLKTKAAKVQELFDCDVLTLRCSPLKTLDDVSVEEILAHYDAHKKIPSNIEKIRDWYPTEIGQLPLEVARLVCQRTNCWWDSKLRKRLAFYIKIVAFSVALLITGLAFQQDVNFVTFVLILGGLTPFFQYCIRYYSNQQEASTNLNSLINFINFQWGKALTNGANLEQLTEASRRIQDELFENRARSPLIPGLIYKVLRRKDEEIMNRSARILIEEAKEKLQLMNFK